MSFIGPPVAPDFGAVMNAAEALGISEYDFFRLAFRRWWGKEADEKTLERIFVAYMFQQAVPTWVRHLTRDVISQTADGKLDAAKLGALKYKRRLPPSRHGGLYLGLMAALTVFYCVALLDISYDPGTSAPMPCYGRLGFKNISGMAHAVSGKQPPSCEELRGTR